jgi:hypothetical protein
MITLELNDEQHRLVADLVEARIQELHPEIHHTRTFTYRDELKKELNTLRALQEMLLEAAPRGAAR